MVNNQEAIVVSVVEYPDSQERFAWIFDREFYKLSRVKIVMDHSSNRENDPRNATEIMAEINGKNVREARENDE